MEAVEFQTLRTVTFAENETMDLAVEAVTPGVSGNVPANTITIMASPINGVTAITNSEKTSGGAEEENDEDYYERIHAEFQDSQFYVANDADYIKWAKEVPGIGDCIVEPAIEGPGTVGLILVDSNGQPASSTLVTAVYNHIVSPDDRSKRLLPTGSSKLIVKSATVKTVDFACTGLVLDGVMVQQPVSHLFHQNGFPGAADPGENFDQVLVHERNGLFQVVMVRDHGFHHPFNKIPYFNTLSYI